MTLGLLGSAGGSGLALTAGRFANLLAGRLAAAGRRNGMLTHLRRQTENANTRGPVDQTGKGWSVKFLQMHQSPSIPK